MGRCGKASGAKVYPWRPCSNEIWDRCWLLCLAKNTSSTLCLDMPGAQQSHLPELKYTRSAMEKCKQIANLHRYKLNIIQPCRLFTSIHYSQRGYPQHPNFARLSWWLRGSALPLEFKSQAQKHWTLRCRPCKQGSWRFLTGSTCSIMQLISWFSMIFSAYIICLI